MALVTICDNCKQIIREPKIKKQVIINNKETDLQYHSRHRSSSDNGFTFNYNFDLCLDCFKKIIKDFKD